MVLVYNRSVIEVLSEINIKKQFYLRKEVDL